MLKGFDDKILESFAGTGNIFKMGKINPGDYVVGIGCGAGLDSLIAARMAGQERQVIGVDMTSKMIEKAQSSADIYQTNNVRSV